jgi:hypothetical protein
VYFFDAIENEEELEDELQLHPIITKPIPFNQRTCHNLGSGYHVGIYRRWTSLETGKCNKATTTSDTDVSCTMLKSS